MAQVLWVTGAPASRFGVQVAAGPQTTAFCALSECMESTASERAAPAARGGAGILARVGVSALWTRRGACATHAPPGGHLPSHACLGVNAVKRWGSSPT